jgi:hypothetical protein
MTTSGGGGFCDCGDTEAWKEGPYCQKHELNTSEVEEEEVKTFSQSYFKGNPIITMNFDYFQK